MKNLIKYLLSITFLVSYAQEKESNGILMPLKSTIDINKTDTNDSIILKAAHVVPTENQYEALKNEFIAFIHFGPNSFTGVEWGSGFEDPRKIDLHSLDTDQWCETMKSAGMKMVIITVKHHDGFVLWQSRYTEHGVMSTKYKDGNGDILKELSESCKKYNLKLGVYLSPADLFQIENKEGLYGNLSTYTERTIPRPVEGRPFDNKTTFTFKVDDYNEYFLNQLYELLTEYGPIHEVWFDGAHPKRKGGQTYNYLNWKELITTLAPKAVIFGRQDIRWCGNESGKTRDTEFNTIPYQKDPNKMNNFFDITSEDVGSREKLFKANYLHYQQAETNTSIREGWFYRDEKQKVRSVDDVFDMYERSVGGNSTFLLNIPPNTEGKFSDQEVEVLKEVGQRIRNTYDSNLFSGASGPKNVLDSDMITSQLLDATNNGIIITTKEKEPVTINRIVLQEAITTHGERVEKHAVDAWLNNTWKEIALATNIGYKRILRFPEVTSSKFRIRVLESRFYPAISNITAHYYKKRPPQLSIERNLEGMVTIQAKKDEFGWKPHGENASENINSGYEIRYTIDGSAPTSTSKLFEKPFLFQSGEVKAVATIDNNVGSIAARSLGFIKKEWKILNTDSHTGEHSAELAFDENPATYWQSNSKGDSHYIGIVFGKEVEIKGFAYSPQKDHKEGMIEKGILRTSKDGENWETLDGFEFGNLINDPTPRTHYFKAPIHTKYIRIESKVIAGGGNTAAIAELDFF